MNRRFAFALLAAAASTLPSAPRTSAAEPAPRPLAEGIVLVPGTFVPGLQPDGNSVVIAAPEGAILIDTGRHPEHTRRALAAADAQGGPIAVLNTHWHLDHTGGNVLLRRDRPGVPVLATDAVNGALEGFLADYGRQLEAVIAAEGTPEEARSRYRQELGLLAAGPLLVPTEVVRASGPRTIGGRTLELHVEPTAVSAADLWIYDPASRTAIAGDLVTLPFPLLDTACPEGWKTALDRLAAVDFAILVPGHGEPMDRAGFETWRSAYGELLACAASERPSTACVEGWIAALGARIPDPDHARAMGSYYVEQVLRGDPDRRASRCAGR